MPVVLAFAITLLVAVLLSGVAHRTVLSTAVLFLAAGACLGNDAFGLINVHDSDLVGRFAEIALFSILFTDGMRVSFRAAAGAWRLPARALGLGMPLTLLGTGVLAHVLMDLPWSQALLLGAVLSPTDPVLAAAIVGRKEVPARLRRLLNVESGLNDGIALPAVLAFLALSTGQGTNLVVPLLQAVLGVAVGIALAWSVVRLARTRYFNAVDIYEPLLGFAIGLAVLALCAVLGLNELLAAFAAGVTVANTDAKAHDAFREFGDGLSELFKLAGLMMFGALLSPPFFFTIHWTGYLFAALALLVVRPVCLGAALIGSPLRRDERIVAVWFGPKGFASVFFGLLVLHSGLDDADLLFHVAALVITVSIVAHSSTDVLIARWYLNAGKEKDEGRAGGTSNAGATAERMQPRLAGDET